MEGSIEAESGIVSDVRGWRNTGMKAENSGIVRMRLAWTKGKKFEVGSNAGSPEYWVDTTDSMVVATSGECHRREHDYE